MVEQRGGSRDIEKVYVGEKFGLFHEYWRPKIAGELNDSYVKLVKLKGEFVVIPKDMEHLPVAEEEVHVVLLEPKSTLNTGNVRDSRTVDALDRI